MPQKWSTFELLGIAQQELVGMLHLQVKLDGLQQDAFQHHHLLLLGKGSVLKQVVTDFVSAKLNDKIAPT